MLPTLQFYPRKVRPMTTNHPWKLPLAIFTGNKWRSSRTFPSFYSNARKLEFPCSFQKRCVITRSVRGLWVASVFCTVNWGKKKWPGKEKGLIASLKCRLTWRPYGALIYEWSGSYRRGFVAIKFYPNLTRTQKKDLKISYPSS